MEIVPYGGWDRCARLRFAGLELLLTLEVGPRIIRFGSADGPNLLHENASQMGLTGGDEYRSYGGHRLWIAPEDPIRTMQPENGPVEHTEEAGFHLFRSAPDKFHLQKEIGVRVEQGAVVLRHRIHNRGAYDVELAPWALTVMAPGGECLIPHSPFVPHTERLLPVRPLVLWGYTRMDDPRWTWGPDLIRLRQDAQLGPQKVGMLVQQGYAAYAFEGSLFLKRFDYFEGREYPDMGCNFETFTRQDMLEVESLGPLQIVGPGDFAEHFETWYLLTSAKPPEANAEAARWLDEIASKHPHRADRERDWPEVLDSVSS